MELINKDAVIAEIEKIYNSDYRFLSSVIAENVRYFKDTLIMNLNTLEVKEVDLDKEIDLFVNGWNIDEFLGLVNDEGWPVTVLDIKNVARHFYELGLKANNNSVIEKACEWLKNNVTYTHPRTGETKCVVNLNAFIDAMKG